MNEYTELTSNPRHWIALPRGWVALPADELADYLAGHFVPLLSREIEHGVEVFDPHEWPERRTGTRICQRCRLLPLDYDSVDTQCVDPELDLTGVSHAERAKLPRTFPTPEWEH